MQRRCPGVRAATHRPLPAADPQPGATGSSWSRRNRCRRRRRHLHLLPARQLPGGAARLARALFRSFKNDYEFLTNFIGNQGSEQAAQRQLRRGWWGAGDSTPHICVPAALRSMRRAWSAHAPRTPGSPSRLHPGSGWSRRTGLRSPCVQWGDRRRAGAPRSWILANRN